MKGQFVAHDDDEDLGGKELLIRGGNLRFVDLFHEG